MPRPAPWARFVRNSTSFSRRAFAVAKRVRTETAVGSSSVSIASVAVELAKKIFGNLQGKTRLLVGAGKMSELAARHLMAHGCASIFVANRTYDRAVGLAQKFNGQAIQFDQLYDTCDRADIVITSTGAPTPSSAANMARNSSAPPQEPSHVLHRHRGPARRRSRR